MFVSTLFCGSNMLNRAFITKTTSGELGFRNRKSTRDDLLLTDVGVRFPLETRLFVSLDTWGRQKSSLGRGSLLAVTLGVDRKAPWDEALC